MSDVQPVLLLTQDLNQVLYTRDVFPMVYSPGMVSGPYQRVALFGKCISFTFVSQPEQDRQDSQDKNKSHIILSILSILTILSILSILLDVAPVRCRSC